MAKKKPVTTSLAAVSDSAEIPLIEVPPGGTLTVGVDVGPMSIPYTVAYAGRTLIKSLVDRVADAIPLEPGDRVLGWAFAHTEKAWHHRIGISLNGGPVRILERKSEDNKDPDHSVGVAIVRALLLILALCIPTRSALAQSTAALDAKIHERWKAIVTEVEGAQRKSLAAAATTPEERQAIYREVIDRISHDPELRKMATPDVALVNATTRAKDREFFQHVETGGIQEAPASVNSASTNPAAGNLTERSGFTDFLALALNGQNFFSADGNAVSLNLNALALYSLADPKVFSELYRYRQHSLVRRFGGTVVFGGKLPEKEITGISGLPDADKILDVFTWDIKVRVIGDKDPRSNQWYALTLGVGGLLTQMSAVVTADVPASDLGLVVTLLNEALGKNLAEIKGQITRSPQLTFKTSGTHVTKETGKNKYTAALLFDSGFGTNTDVTANLLYSVIDDVRLGADKAFQIKQVNLNASVTARLAPDGIVKGRSIDWNSGATATIFTNKQVLPIPVQNTWKLFTGLDIPVTDAAKIPVSIVYTNDPNALEKTEYVSGLVGISYDFSALKKLFTR